MQSALKTGANLKLKALRSIAGLLPERAAHAELQRSDRRKPRQPDARGCTQVVKPGCLRLLPHTAHIKIREHANGPILRHSGQRKEQLRVQQKPLIAAECPAIAGTRTNPTGAKLRTEPIPPT